MSQTAILALLAIGAYFLLNQQVASTGTPVFKNMSNQVISSIACGNSVIFDCPGYSMIWLTRTKNGVQDVNGPYAVPMPPYIMNCATDVGSYVLTAYQLTAANTQGALLGSVSFTVTAS